MPIKEGFLDHIKAIHFGSNSDGVLIINPSTDVNGVGGQTDASMLSGVTITMPDGRTYSPLSGDIPTLLPVDPQNDTYLIDYEKNGLPNVPIWKEVVYSFNIPDTPSPGLWWLAPRVATHHGTRVFVNLKKWVQYADANGDISITLHVPGFTNNQVVTFGNQQWSNFGAQATPAAWVIPDALGTPIMSSPTTANTYPTIPHPDINDCGWAGAYATSGDAIAHDIAAGLDPSNYSQFSEPFGDDYSASDAIISLATYHHPFRFHSVNWGWLDTASQVSTGFLAQSSPTTFSAGAATQTFKIKVRKAVLGHGLFDIT